ncbi:enolase-binding protein-like [Topomyia yanbarensis]|uniref:enolase-binding protein-like n=1 Tax=Topomyia yanbarensis TaxID=2498891 RepID=UPI00273BEC93|nr:enolase-binding protein-like [Topomyia yanbarensis]
MILRLQSIAIVAILLVTLGEHSIVCESVFEGSQQEVNITSFLSQICDNKFSLMTAMVKSFSGEHIDRNLEHLCAEGVHGLLIWITADNFDKLSEIDTNLKYIGRTTTADVFSGYCVYDPNNRTCTNEHAESKNSVMILGEKYPERYELRDIVYKKWTNSTVLGSPVLAYATLKNRDSSYKYIDQDISYLSDTRIDHRLPETVTAGLPLSVYRGKIEAYKAISGETYYSRSFQTINAVRYMSPFTLINVTVIGTEEKAYREFRAKLVTVYTDEGAYGWSRVLTSVEGASVETSLTETRVQYSAVTNLNDESQRPNGPELKPDNPHTDHRYPGQPIMAKAENINIHINELEMGQVYPGFRPYGIGAAIILFSVLGIAVLDMTRRIIRERRARRLHQGKYRHVNAS